jgi:hypothetical protein
LFKDKCSCFPFTLPSNPSLVVLWREIHIPLFIDLYFF